MAVLNQDIYIGGSVGNVFDVNAWKTVPVDHGSLSVTGDAIILSTESSEYAAYTKYGSSNYPDSARIYVHAGEKVKATWASSYDIGEFRFYYNGGAVANTDSDEEFLEYIVPSEVTYLEVSISTGKSGSDKTVGISGISIEVDPIFSFNKDQIEDPEGIQSVDLIEERLPIDTFTPIVYYSTDSLKNLFNFEEWSYASVYNGSKTTLINKFTLLSSDDDCYTAYLEDEYPPEARIPVVEGETINLLWTASGALGSVTVCPEGSLTGAVSTISANEELAYTVPSDVSFVTLRFGVVSAGQSVTFSDIVIKKISDAPDSLRELPFGTIVRYYIDDELVHKYYIRSVERISRQAFKLDCVSAIGILDKIYHIGGVYLGTTFGSILSEIISGIVNYTIDSDVANTKMFGYLPYAKARENLHQMMFAANVTILKNSSGDMHFTFLNNVEDPPENIESNRIYISGSVEYPTIATEILLTEHSFQYDDTLDRVTLIDNTNAKPANNKVFIFDNAPIVVDSMMVSEGLTVSYAHPNFAIVSGNGILTGIPYYDKTSILSRTNPSSGDDYTISSNDVTLITPLNSENVADRLMSYYSSAKIVKGDIKLANEKTGRRYKFIDAFNEVVIGYLKRLTTYSSSFIKATCEFITGYISSKFGNNYSYYAVITDPGTLRVPEGTKILRLTIIGGGDGGQSGLAATEPDRFSTSGGIGGEGGEAGEGGYIKEIILHNPTAGDYTCTIGAGGSGTLECTSTETHLEGGTGTHSTVTTPGGVTYSSGDNDAYRCESGIMNLFTGVVYARKGREGIKGGNGGRGGSAGPGEAGESITYRGITRTGGIGGSAIEFSFTHVEQSVITGGAGGSGAQAYANGLNGGNGLLATYDDLTSSYSSYKAWEEATFRRGLPATPTPVYDSSRVYQPGDGGDAGHGGAGRGGWGTIGSCELLSKDSSSNLSMHVVAWDGGDNVDQRTAYSSKGLKGDPGQSGVILVYSDQPVTYGANALDTPTITNTSTSSQVSFSLVNVGNNVSYQIERRDL